MTFLIYFYCCGPYLSLSVATRKQKPSHPWEIVNYILKYSHLCHFYLTDLTLLFYLFNILTYS